MKRNTFLAALALFIAAVGVVIALTAYFKNRNNYLYDDDDDFFFDDPDDLEYYSSDLTDDNDFSDLEAEDGVDFSSED